MAENIIYYGPPGTGKTYFMQKQIDRYTDYKIEDNDIKDAYILKTEDWLLITLVVLQNNDPMSSPEIVSKIRTLNLGHARTVSDVLEEHSKNESSMGIKRKQPRIFFEITGKWFVDRLNLLEFDPTFLINYIQKQRIEKRFDFVTFHQSFSYEDFIEGIRPNIDPVTNLINYKPQDGIFKRICERARHNPSKQYAIFIDEINRGNISEIFGELISLIELDKREGQYCELEAVLPYSKSKFTVPNNLNVIGTMNSADKSISNIDVALRRRFDFVGFPCNYQELGQVLAIKGLNPNDIDGIDVIKLLKVINKRIELLLDTNYVIGHAFFMKIESWLDVKAVILKKIFPLLEEYFFDDLQKIQVVLNDIDETGELVPNPIYTHEELEVDSLLSFVGDYVVETKRVYSLNYDFNRDSIVKIYDGIDI